MDKQDDQLSWTFHHWYDRGRDCYFVGSQLVGKIDDDEVVQRFKNKEVLMMLKSEDHKFITEYVAFEQVNNVYQTQKPFQIPVAVAGNNFANLRADLVVRNALIARISLENLVT